MTGQRNIRWIYAISILFVVLNIFLMMAENYYLNFLPLLFIVILLAFFSLDKLLLLTVFFTPLSLNLADKEVGLGLSLPTEPIFFGITILFVFKLLHDKKYDWAILKHPITLSVFATLTWIFITSLTSGMPVVSLKFLLARIWFIVPFYFLGILLFKSIKNIRYFFWLYIVSLTLVIGYTLYNHSLYGFDEESANWVVSPFYNDHTSYGAALAMFFPVLIGFLFNNKYSMLIKITAFMFTSIFTLAIILSYTRAAWVSLAAAFIMWIVLLLKIKFRTLLLLIGGIVCVILLNWTSIIIELEKNKQDSSRDLAEHIQSISNVSSDASNQERLNRWNSAFRMFMDKPILGFGPGTYAFNYAPYQLSSEKTIISTNMADAGNAHSEYIGPLAEQGILGAVNMIVLALIVISTGIRVVYTNPNKEIRVLVISVTLGLITYFAHGALNNFLDSDKAAVPFWGFIAMLVAIDLYHKKQGVLENSTAE